MKKRLSGILITVIIVATLVTTMSLGVCAKSTARVYPKTSEDLNGLRAGVTVGTIHDGVVKEKFPNSSISYLNSFADMVGAIKSDKIDYFVIDKGVASTMLSETPDLKIIDDTLFDMPMGFIFPKSSNGEKLQKEFNTFLAKILSDGTIDSLYDKWLGSDALDVSAVETMDIELTGENGTLDLATNQTSPPFVFVQGNELRGFDIEITKMFCKEYGYDLTYSASDFSGIIPAVTSEKSDFGAAGIAITDERKKSVLFSDAYSYLPTVAIALTEEGTGFSISAIKESFNKTFVVEDRWKNILDGIKVTLNISLLSTLFGTLIGFLIYMACRKGNKPLNKFFDGFSWLFSGLPMVVILMILYYIILAKSSIDGEMVSVIAFGTSVALSVYSMLKTAVKSIDRGQVEGSYSLGFTDRQTFFGIVLPQAMTQFLPNYKDALVNMIKGTAIVGYIAVQDLTKISDVIRSRTYDAFFPLIATAIIYLLLICIFTSVIKRIEIKYEPKKRSEEMILREYRK